MSKKYKITFHTIDELIEKVDKLKEFSRKDNLLLSRKLKKANIPFEWYTRHTLAININDLGEVGRDLIKKREGSLGNIIKQLES